MAKPIGLLGGTFDPVHNGHLRMALEIRNQLNLSEVRLIPLNIPPHRTTPVVDNEHRLNMLTKAIHGVDGLVIDDREINRNEVSWTINTVTTLRNELPDHSLCLIMGEDAFATLDSWKSWQELTNFVHIIVASRTDVSMVNFSETIITYLNKNEITEADKINESRSGFIYRAQIPILDISSTRIRELIARDQNPEFLMPGPVLEYIKDNHLYT